MKVHIVALWIVVASASTRFVREKRDIGISSGYGGAYGYDSALSIGDVDKSSLSDASVSRQTSRNGVDRNLMSNDSLQSDYGKAYGYVTALNVNSINKGLQVGNAISSGYGGAYGYASTPRETNVNRDLVNNHAISSGYGGAYGYFPASKVDRLPSSFAVSSNDGVYGDGLLRSVANNEDGLSSSVAVASGYGGAYGYSPISILNINNERDQKVEMPQVPKVRKVSILRRILKSLPGYSGYGNRINSYSGYSRYPEHAGYGFAYANGWL